MLLSRFQHSTQFSNSQKTIPVQNPAMRISVVIPTFNRIEVIQRAIESVLRQTRPPDQLIVVDDGSTDGTSALLKKTYRNRLTLISLAQNKGVSAARNHGIRESRGDWIALLDSDDEWLESKLATQQMALESQPHVLCHTEEIWIRNGIRVNAMNKHAKRGGDIYQYCLPLCVISPSSALISRKAFNEAGGFDETLPACEDYDLWLKICARHSVLFVPTPQVIKYGGHDDQLSRQHWGMDRFRIKAMINSLESGNLSCDQSEKTHECLWNKTRIFLKGAIKHDNHAMIEYCQQILDRKFICEKAAND